jgi:hypothetical protein
MPVTVADLVAEVSTQVAVALAEAGVYLRALDDGGNPTTPFILQGLRKGVKAVGLAPANPLYLTDGDAARVSPFAVERVLLEARLHALEMTLLNWNRAVRKHDDHALSPAPMAGGWLSEQRRDIAGQVASLRAECQKPYREPADPIVVAHPHVGFGPPIPADAVTPYDPEFHYYGPHGFGPWY